MNIVEFLNARIAEDEYVVDLASLLSVDQALYGRNVWNGPGHAPTMTGKRLAAECEAKRKIIDDCGIIWDSHDEYAVGMRDDTLNNLASIYRDHPDFDPRWSE